MMEYIKGTLIETNPIRTIIEAGGIGYRIYTPLSHYAKLPTPGNPTCLYIATVIREDSHKTYGFLSASERDLFEVLIDVSGIGPKTALSLLGHLAPSDLQLAIGSADISSICKVPGIGKKTAERLIIEMRDKIHKHTPQIEANKPISTTARDALSALINLGYQPQLVQKAIEKILGAETQEPDLTTLITSALKTLASTSR
jgi:holliday junction DNA helicase RuvA